MSSTCRRDSILTSRPSLLDLNSTGSRLDEWLKYRAVYEISLAASSIAIPVHVSHSEIEISVMHDIREQAMGRRSSR